jgi:hypothetical protein
MRHFIFIILAVIAFFSCQRESFYGRSDAALKFSADTVLFDTIFSGIGSPTLRLMVRNPYNQTLKISTIQLAKGESSNFKININGKSSVLENNLEIEPHDSMYIFVQVFGETNGIDTSVQIRDSIIFKTNGNTQYIKLLAYNQDVFQLKNTVLKTQTWEGRKPYFITGNVVVDSLETLYIKKGISVYFGFNSNLIVKGTLNAEGEYKKNIVFRDKNFRKAAGQWGGIVFMPGSKNNLLNWAEIKNGTTGVKLGDYLKTDQSQIEIKNSTIRNMIYSCLYAENSQIKASNCVIADGGNFTCALLSGGDYEFYHCTIIRYNSPDHSVGGSNSALYFSNTNASNTNKLINPWNALNLKVFNTIVYGASYNEIDYDTTTSKPFNYEFTNCLLRSSTFKEFAKAEFTANCIWNKDPKFRSVDSLFLTVDSLSPARNAGSVDIGKLFPLDLNLKDRTQTTAPTIGAFQ